MRVGKNPIHNTKIITKKAYHRVIMPVYIPSLDGYYKNSFKILELCVNSLLQTIHPKTSITIINNSSCNEVTTYLRNLLSEKKIDQLIDYQENKGKVDPLVSAMRGSSEELITITDADVLFTEGWQHAVEEIFEAIPYVGMVSPLPYPKLRNYYSSYSWFWGIMHNALIRIENFDTNNILDFKKSINADTSLSHDEVYPVGVAINGIIAVIGSGHFCATYHKNIVKFIPEGKSGEIFKGAEVKFLDYPVEKGGFMRLSTAKGFVYHMGNTLDYSIKSIEQKVDKNPKVATLDIVFKRKNFASRLIRFIFSKKKIINYLSKHVKVHNNSHT